jgi:hypothetical protein
MMNTMGAAVNAPQDRSSPVDRRRQGGTYRPRKDAMDLMTFYRYRVELRPHAAAVETADQSHSSRQPRMPLPSPSRGRHRNSEDDAFTLAA